MPAIVERPVTSHGNGGGHKNWQSSEKIYSRGRLRFRKNLSNQPANTETSSNGQGNKGRQVIRILIFRNRITDRIKQIGHENEDQKPKSSPIAFEQLNETGDREEKGRGNPGKP